jgi:hypothetical protein
MVAACRAAAATAMAELRGWMRGDFMSWKLLPTQWKNLGSPINAATECSADTDQNLLKYRLDTYADAYEAWDKSAAINFEGRRDYRKAREFQERRPANTGTCTPHAGTDQRVAVTPNGEQPTGTAIPQPPPH